MPYSLKQRSYQRNPLKGVVENGIKTLIQITFEVLAQSQNRNIIQESINAFAEEGKQREK